MENTLEKQKWYRLMVIGIMLYIILKTVSGIIEEQLRFLLLHSKVNVYTTFWIVIFASSIPVIVVAFITSKRIYKRILNDPLRLRNVFIQSIVVLALIWSIDIILPFVIGDYYIDYNYLYDENKPDQLLEYYNFRYFLIIGNAIAGPLETVLILLAIGIKK